MPAPDIHDGEDAVGLAALVRDGAAAPLALLDAAIARATEADARFGFMAQWCVDRARAAASRPLPDSPLAGVPFLVKDLGVDIAGVPTGAGSRYFAATPDRSSTMVERAEAAGLLIFGKTTTPELGLTVTTESVAHGPTRNPWNPDRTAGGSSGGSAVAVAAGVVPLAQASDGGGSIRVPASCCGIFGLKPSRGLVPMGPCVIESWNGLAVKGPVSRTVRDAAAFLDVLAGPEPGSRVIPPRPAGGYLAAVEAPLARLRVALMEAPYSGVAVDPEVLATLSTAAGVLADRGDAVEAARPALDWDTLNDANLRVVAGSVGRDFARQEARLGRPPADGEVEEVTAMWRHIAASVSAAQLEEALQTIEQATATVDRFFDRHDILLSPVLATPPVPLGLLRLDQPSDRFGAAFGAFCPFASLANLTGCPAISLPLGLCADGLPIGVMAMARFGEEALLLALARHFEKAMPWAGRRPA